MQRPTSLFKFDNEYQDALSFIKSNPEISFEDFDDYILGDLRLFDVPKESAIDRINELVDEIIRSLPAIKRIFSRPIIHLKDVYELLPIESVRKINNYTLAHASIHSELWSDITDDGIKPKKLMTLDRTENYAIYENIVFTYAVDMILRFVKKTIIMLNDIMYSCRDMYFNMLDMTHHSLYFLAIGKLHVEYVLAQTQKRNVYSECIDKLLFIEKTIRSKLSSPVYKQCKGFKKKISLKRTNTFRSHKDYKQIYKLLKTFNSNIENEGLVFEEPSQLSEYRAYCVLLSIFSAEHFNFKMQPETKMDLEHINADFSLCNWNFNISEGEYNGIVWIEYNFKRDTEYKICMILNDAHEISALSMNDLKQRCVADEYLFVSPRAYGKRETVYLSIHDIDSFRRLQQIMQRGMIYSDNTHDVCPFCKGKLTEDHGTYECHVCQAVISRKTCATTGKDYYVSGIKRYKAALDTFTGSNQFLHDRLNEAKLHFRNITPIMPDGTPICPKCGMIH